MLRPEENKGEVCLRRGRKGIKSGDAVKAETARGQKKLKKGRDWRGKERGGCPSRCDLRCNEFEDEFPSR